MSIFSIYLFSITLWVDERQDIIEWRWVWRERTLSWKRHSRKQSPILSFFTKIVRSKKRCKELMSKKKIVPFLPMSTAKHCKIFYRNSLIFPCKYNFWRGIWVLLWWLMTIFGGVSIWCWIVLSLEPIVPSLVVRKQDLCRLGWEKIHQKYTLQVILPLEVAKTALLQFGRNHQEGVLRYSAKYLSSSKSLVWQKMGSPEKRFMWRIQWAQHYFPVQCAATNTIPLIHWT